MAQTNSWIKVFRRAIKVSVGTGWTVQPDRGNIRVLYGTKATGFLSINLPYKWQDTPNIHLCTIKDFMDFCKENNYEITEKYIANDKQKKNLFNKVMPNLFGEVATFRIR